MTRIPMRMGIAVCPVIVQKSPQRLDSVAVHTHTLVRDRAQEHPFRRRLVALGLMGRRRPVRLMAGKAGDDAGLGRCAAVVEGRPVIRVSGPRAIQDGDIRVIYISRKTTASTGPGLVARRTVAGAEVPAGKGPVSPCPIGIGLRVDQMTDTARP